MPKCDSAQHSSSQYSLTCCACVCALCALWRFLHDSSVSDPADDVITPEDVFDLMEEDVQQADLVLWIGISFEQSASTAYFRRVSCSHCTAFTPLL